MLHIEILESGHVDCQDSAFPTLVRLDGDTVLTVHWCAEEGVCGIRWTRLKVAW